MALPKASRPAADLTVNGPRTIDLLAGINREAKAKTPQLQAAANRLVGELATAADFHMRCWDRPAPVNAARARRQLAARPYIPTEPRRPRAADIERMCAELPYGYWHDATGRIVIFNRRYRPLWQRLNDGTIERANPGEWIHFVEQRWFNWSDARYEKTARERLRQILQDFFDGKDLVVRTIVTEWDCDEARQR